MTKFGNPRHVLSSTQKNSITRFARSLSTFFLVSQKTLRQTGPPRERFPTRTAASITRALHPAGPFPAAAKRAYLPPRPRCQHLFTIFFFPRFSCLFPIPQTLSSKTPLFCLFPYPQLFHLDTYKTPPFFPKPQAFQKNPRVFSGNPNNLNGKEKKRREEKGREKNTIISSVPSPFPRLPFPPPSLRTTPLRGPY